MAKEDLEKELILSKELIEKVKGKYSSKVEKQVNLLEEVVQPEKKRKIVSFVDPDARFGIKNNTKKFAGYKAHIVEDESGIVTSCETLKGDENEGQHESFERILQKEDEKGLTSKAVVCDTLYDSFANRRAIEKRGMEYYIPEKRKKKKLNRFLYDQKEDRFICPQGYTSVGKCYYKGGHYYYFSPRPCRSCKIKKTCALGRENPLVYVSDSHLLFMKTDPEKMKIALYKRKRIEAKFGEAKKHHGMTRARYRGKWRVSIQVLMSFIVMNLKRMVKLLKMREESVRLAFSSG